MRFFDFFARTSGVAGGALVGGLVAATLVAAHPAAYAAALKTVAGAIACNTTATCVTVANANSGPAIVATSAQGTALTSSGVSGLTATGTNGIGVQGSSTSNYGVRGASTSDNGVVGVSKAAYGLRGTSTTSDAVYGSTTSGTAGVAGTSPDGYGVYGFTTGKAGGFGVYGASPAGVGVYGTDPTGNVNGVGVIGETTGAGSGVIGRATDGVGVEGQSSKNNAVAGFASGTNNGVFGMSASGVGVYGDSQIGNSSGLLGIAEDSGDGLYAFSNLGHAVEAQNNASDHAAVFAMNANGDGGEFNGTHYGIVGRAPAAAGFPLVLTDSNNNDVFYVDGAGNVSYHGSLHNFSVIRGGATVRAFSPRTTSATVEDTGTAALVNGVSAVRLDPTFAQTIDPAIGYRVFITPDGDTRGLFVAAKTAAGFIVRESQDGRSSVAFDYRVVATSLGQGGARMAIVKEAPPFAPLLAHPRRKPPLSKPAVLPAFVPRH